MNPKPFLVISILLNLGLAAGMVYLMGGRPKPVVRDSGEHLPPVAATSNAPASMRPGSRTVAVVTNSIVQKFDWRSVEHDDYKKYIANLRSVGCPEETIRDIIVADVNKLFEDRKRSLTKPTEKFKFWETGMQKMFAGAMDEEALKQQQSLAAEKRALIKDLLGIEVEEKVDVMAMFNPFERILDFLPSSKQTQILEKLQQFQARQMKKMGDSPDEMDMKEMQKAQLEMEGEIAKILSPQEFEDYQLRMSNTAMMLRMTLDGFEPSEQEFRNIFKEQKAFDDQFSPFGGYGLSGDKTEMDKRQAAQKELDEKLKSTLGEKRFEEFQREKDHEFKSIAKVATRQGLPKDAAVKVYDMKKTATDEANKLRNDKSLSNEQRNAALKAMRAETERSMTEVLGEKGMGSYKKNAWWLNNISHEEIAKPTPVETAP